MYKSANRFQTSINKPDRQSHPKEEFVWALLSRVVEMTAYQLLVAEIKRRSSELRRLDHPSALCTAQSLDALPSLEPISMVSKHEMRSLSRSNIDNILLQSYLEYKRYRGACEQAISICKKFQESTVINNKLPSIPKAIMKRLDAETLLKEIFISIIDETREKWPQWAPQ